MWIDNFKPTSISSAYMKMIMEMISGRAGA
jgi:hypothetical protein